MYMTKESCLVSDPYPARIGYIVGWISHKSLFTKICFVTFKRKSRQVHVFAPTACDSKTRSSAKIKFWRFCTSLSRPVTRILEWCLIFMGPKDLPSGKKGKPDHIPVNFIGDASSFIGQRMISTCFTGYERSRPEPQGWMADRWTIKRKKFV